MPWTTTTTRASGYTVTAAVWNSEHVDNMNYLKETTGFYTQFTGNVTVNTTSEATAVSVVSSGAITYEAVPHMIEFYAPSFDSNGDTLHIILQDGSTVLGDLYQGAGSGNADCLGTLSRRITPTAASHTYQVKAWISAGSGTIHADTGGSSAKRFPGFLRIFRVPA